MRLLILTMLTALSGRVAAICHYETHATWGPDDSHIVYYSYATGNGELIWMDLGSGEKHALTHDSKNQWFPFYAHQGPTLLFAGDGAFREPFAGGDLFLGELTSDKQLTNVNQITDLPVGSMAFGAQWSPDDSKVVYMLQDMPNQTSTLWLLDLSTMKQQRLSPEDQTRDTFPTFAPNGDEILFVTEVDGEKQFAMQHLASGDRRIIPTIPGDRMQPRYSPDGQTIAFTLSPTGDQADTDLYLMDRDGQNPKLLAQLPASQHNPEWSRDGTRIAFSSYEFANTAEIFVINRDGSGIENITRSSLDCG